MLGYLKRGQTYRRRGEFVAAIRDLRRASEIDPTATRPLEELGDAYLADTPHRYGAAGRALRAVRPAGQPRAARALQAGVRALQRGHADAGDRCAAAGARHRRHASPRPTTCSGCATATRSSRRRRGRRSSGRSRCSRRCSTRARSWRICIGALGTRRRSPDQLEALTRARSGSVARRRARPRLRARRPDRTRRHDAGRAAERYPEHPLRLRRARPGVAGDRAGARRSRRAQQGARGARRGRRAATTAARR